MTSVLSFFLLCTNRHKKRKNKKWLRFIVFPFMYEKTQKRKNKNRLPFYLCSFLVRTNAKTEKRQMTSFLSFFLLCTKTHKNIQTEIDFRSIVFRCKYDQSMKERTGYNLIFCLYFFRLLWLFKWTKSRDGEGSGSGGRGLSGGRWFLSETRLGVVGQQFL